jgi:hypothetical protein
MPNLELTEEEFKRQYDAAVAREKEAAEVEPRAVAARVQDESLIFELMGNITVTIPLALLPGLPANATLEELAEVQVSPSGEGLIWESLNVSVSVPGLMLKLAGAERIRRQIMVEATRKAASVVTEKRRDAARKNGAKGGRPRKVRSAGG